MKFYDLWEFIKIIIIFLILIILPCFLIAYPTIISYSNNEIIEIEIKEKYIKNNKGNGNYMIVDKNNNTYEITDLFFKGKFNSTDLYNNLEIGKKYKIETTGKRIHFLSMYKNINKIIEEK